MARCSGLAGVDVQTLANIAIFPWFAMAITLQVVKGQDSENRFGPPPESMRV